ncbi:hypothetical protein [Microbacterium sp.]|jgi:hypothetical protein|uniref:hypothetical protein n=1 Tax=Microbacterium sp. TaxID=51671 RepID=UPI0037CA1149
MKFAVVRSLATAALITSAALAFPAAAIAATSGSPEEGTTTHAAADTAGSTPALGYWIGGGTLALAGGAIAVGTTVRRHRHDLDT